MKIGLQMGLGQHLTMTPQLQQAIKLLQLSTLELQQEVQSALDSNPLLELDDGSDASSDPLTQVTAGTPETADAASQALDLDQQNDLPNELPVDTAWDDIYVGNSGSGGGDSLDEDGDARVSFQIFLEDAELTRRQLWSVIFIIKDMVVHQAQSLQILMATGLTTRYSEVELSGVAIHAALANPSRVGEIAAAAGLPPSHARLLHDIVGETWVDPDDEDGVVVTAEPMERLMLN